MSDSGFFDVVVNPSIEIDAQATSGVLCDGENDNLEIQINNPVAGTNYTWSRTLPSGVSSAGYSTTSNNNLITGNQFSETLTNNSFQIKEVKYTIQASLGDCISSKDIVVEVLPSPRVISSLSINVCGGEEFEYLISAPGATDFIWQIKDDSESGSGSVIRETISNTSTETIKVAYLITPIINGCEGNNSFELEVNVAPEIVFNYTNYDEICSGDTIPDIDSRINIPNATFTWSRANVIGIAESGSAGTHLDLNNQVLTNTTNSPIPVTYVLEISSGSCVKAGRLYSHCKSIYSNDLCSSSLLMLRRGLKLYHSGESNADSSYMVIEMIQIIKLILGYNHYRHISKLTTQY